MAERPILNPTLRLTMEPTPVAGPGGGKSKATVVTRRLDEQRSVLAADLRKLRTSPQRIARAAGKSLAVAQMFGDSFAPSYTPRDLLQDGCKFVAPVPTGYLVEIEDGALNELAQRAETATAATVRTDISRVKRIRPYDEQAVLHGRSIETLWDRGLPGVDGERLFTAWLMPFKSEKAREALLMKFEQTVVEAGVIDPAREIVARTNNIANTSAGGAMRSYRASGGVGRAIIGISSEEALGRLIASGTVFRMDPVRKVVLSSGIKTGGARKVLPSGQGPIVACIDGGLTDSNYFGAEAWRMTPFVSNEDANAAHGNAVGSLIAHAYELNQDLDLPELQCKLGILQAVPHDDAEGVYLPDDLYDALTRLAVRHRDTRVWNLSFNYADFDDDPDVMSDFGHQVSTIARTAGVLPVISIGNVRGNQGRLLPPGDAEAAITVGGRVASDDGIGDHCENCCVGPGPGGALKPDLSWYSPLRVGGGQRMVGSSFATALVSSLAAHTFDKLRDPTPDLVRALLIANTERQSHDAGLGWGTPWSGSAPWECDEGSVAMAWSAELDPGFDYYWRDIPIPPQMIIDGKIRGSASLTAVLEPMVSPFAGENYFSSRIEVSLQYQTASGKWSNLLGTMQESTMDELSARSDLKKWQPVRHHKLDDFSKSINPGGKLRVRARVYTRDLFQTGLTVGDAIPTQNVAFVLKLAGSDDGDGLYNSMVAQLGSFVESAIIEQDVNIAID